MNSIRVLLYLSSLFLLMLIGCGQTEFIPEYNPEQMIVPVHEGNYWVSEFVRPFTGDIITTTTQYTKSNLIGPDDHSGWFSLADQPSSWALYKCTNSGFVVSTIRTKDSFKPICVLRDGVPQIEFATLTNKGDDYLGDPKVFLVAKYPVSSNEKWMLYENLEVTSEEEFGPSGNTCDVWMECIAHEQEITVQAGTFTCVVYRETIDYEVQPESVESFERLTYYAPGVGKVLDKYSLNNQEFVISYELVDYHIED